MSTPPRLPYPLQFPVFFKIYTMASDAPTNNDAPRDGTLLLTKIICVIFGVAMIVLLVMFAQKLYERSQKTKRLNRRPMRNIDGTLQSGIELQVPQRALVSRASIGTPTPTYEEAAHDADVPYDARTEVRGGKLYAVDHEYPPGYTAVARE